MEIFDFIFNHFWEIFLFLFFFGGPIGWAITSVAKNIAKHRERMQELKNEELRLQLQLMQTQRGEGFSEPLPRPQGQPAPREATWQEREEAAYQEGYQQQSS
ncbi:hypothetical protein EPA93_03215 [Ktedonosporobacter rubrisoli]|uniref:Uncharacterized protein n=1 Tax=Ktedonosporobacter rubrisoli TaxID=2509675 RepID=A0A4P6JK98_KTERU|nr:hypothetical protein [Ktedonosporobacter rubrisoli]QBD75056.1 hypothetical protein EPA93_03215 [Ktedonosporobacter rubrisoli]